MAYQDSVHIDFASRQTSPVFHQEQQQHHSFDAVSFQDLAFEDTGFWPLHEEFLDSARVLPALTAADTVPLVDSPGILDYNDNSVGNGFIASKIHPHSAHERDPANPEDGAEDWAFRSQDLGSIIPNHYGFGYWMSVCSDPAIAWVRQKVKSNEFAEIAGALKVSWAQQSRLEHTGSTSQSAEPEAHLAWKYCNAYFERSVDNLWEPVYRPDFERHLRAHLAGKIHYHDPAWYALRNVVYAGGCRVYRSQFPEANPSDVWRESWSYFSNALSMHSELLLTKPTLRSVRALLTMAFFAEGLASPSLSSGLVSNAALLAQSLGLHRKRLDTGGHAHSEALQRAWLFWAVYCSEKHIAQRCGQPSLINDDDISCDIPTSVHFGSTIDPETLKYIIQTCQLYDHISKNLLTTRALQEHPEKMLGLVGQFHDQLQAWKDSMPLQLRPTDFLKQFKMPGSMRLLGLMTAHCSFYDLVMVAHSTFMYPWVINSFPENMAPELALRVKAQIQASSRLVANAARSLIVITRSLDMDSIGTQSFTLHYPMRAFINLFVYVIENPQLPSAQSDLSLLDVAAGYFGQMEFVTGSKISFPFARDIAALARCVVDGARATLPEPTAATAHDVDMSNISTPPWVTQHPERMNIDFDAWIL